MSDSDLKFWRSGSVVVGIYFAKGQIVVADFQSGTDPDDIFRMKCLFTKFCRENGL